MYHPVRRAIEDAVWNVLHTVAHAVLLSLLALAGLAAVVVALLVGPTLLGLSVGAVGTLVLLVAVRELAHSFDLRGVLVGPRRRQ
ncbi:hypothetical protein N0B31_17650 [Salinirubellus salinus]|uniref:Uncharacterized protein n=1 Tax=Salinirubellus salinus TaxID=1364945 RepID=A0A9E7R1J6_9EURY|nr:hypothetical protein [Salinirubellus salinus]UWM53937.1 hypothetical protein N0B31_17650 [Salinirubellus salinus]